MDRDDEFEVFENEESDDEELHAIQEVTFLGVSDDSEVITTSAFLQGKREDNAAELVAKAEKFAEQARIAAANANIAKFTACAALARATFATGPARTVSAKAFQATKVATQRAEEEATAAANASEDVAASVLAAKDYLKIIKDMGKNTVAYRAEAADLVLQIIACVTDEAKSFADAATTAENTASKCSAEAVRATDNMGGPDRAKRKDVVGGSAETELTSSATKISGTHPPQTGGQREINRKAPDSKQNVASNALTRDDVVSETVKDLGNTMIENDPLTEYIDPAYNLTNAMNQAPVTVPVVGEDRRPDGQRSLGTATVLSQDTGAQSARQLVMVSPRDGKVVREPSVKQPKEAASHDDDQVEISPHDDEQVTRVRPVRQAVEPAPRGSDELHRSLSARKVEVSKPVPHHVAINMSVTRDDSVDITERIGLSSTVENVVDDLVLVAHHPFNEGGVDITVDAIPDLEPEPEPAEPLAKLIPYGPQLPPITDKNYIKYSHSVWESIIRHKYRHKGQDVVPADKHILRGVAEVSLRKEVSRLLTLSTTPILEESMYLYVKKKEDDMPFLEEEKTSPTSHKGENDNRRRQSKAGMFSGKPKSDAVEATSPKNTAKKKERKLPEPLIVDEMTNQLVPTEFMIDVSAVFPTIIAHYPKYAQKVLCRVGYTKITLVKRRPRKSSSDEHNIVQLRLLSEFPFMYGRVSFDRNLRLTWYRSPFKWLLYQMRLVHEKKSKTLHALCIVPLRRICAFEYLNEEDDSHLYGNPPIRRNGFWSGYSVFTEIVHSENAEAVFEADFWDVVLDFKWRSYATFRWLLICLVEIIYMVLWAVSTNPMVQRYSPNSDSPQWPAWSVHFQIGAIFLGSLFLCNEIRHMIYYGPKRYFLNAYNFFNLLCYILPITISANSLQVGYMGMQTDLTALTVLLLWLHFLQQLRVFKPIGIFVNIFLSSMRQVIPILAVAFVILLGFGHATWILLGTYEVTPNNSTNAFGSFSTSLENYYWGITGDFSGLQSWDGFSTTADVFRFMFTFVAIVYLLNLLIATLVYNYSEASVNAGISFKLQRAKIIAEIECFWMLPRERRNKVNFPDDIFFEARPDNIHLWEEEKEPGNVKFD
ncbi:hypothetical protein BC936DRAFT_139470 [Jimgerdemannia flammicorona]|uniref:Ion transport domain-containing protein n=1 Tax=Jimgerdemannia flammicorona TaxID=994334 RepID=A0A433DHM2_9FUNG|nr:hypothetical protein BC936DRAFT_139470 [Jimgerdemannia flammicorona]